MPPVPPNLGLDVVEAPNLGVDAVEVKASAWLWEHLYFRLILNAMVALPSVLQQLLPLLLLVEVAEWTAQHFHFCLGGRP